MQEAALPRWPVHVDNLFHIREDPHVPGWLPSHVNSGLVRVHDGPVDELVQEPLVGLCIVLR